MALNNASSINVIGFNVERLTTVAEHALGTNALLDDGSVAVYVKASEAITGLGYVCLVGTDYTVAMVSTSNTAGKRGFRVCIPQVAFAANEYGWMIYHGRSDVRVAASAAVSANANLNSTATAGQLDDDATAGAEIIEGVNLTAANGVAAGLVAGVLTEAKVGATI